MNSKYKFTALIVILIFSIYANAQNLRLFDVTKNLEIFTNAYKELNRNFVDEIDPGILMKTGIDAMTKSLDPYTVYYSEAEAESYRINMEGKYSGIGTVMRNIDSVITIVEIYKDSPAYKAGIRIGDKILEVNGKSTQGKSNTDMSLVVRGAPGTDITFKIQSYGENQPKTIKVTRSEIVIPNVPFTGMVNDSIAYIQLTTFTENAGDNVKKSLKELKDSFDVKGVILDLRDNGGGLLREAINVSNVFIENDQELVFTRGKTEDQNKSYKTMKSAFDIKIPLVILINDKSASASEIVSGSIQDLDRGVLIGQKSFGKGLVQNFFPLGYNSRIKMTISKYYIPSGRCIQSKIYENGKAKLIDKNQQTEFKTKNGRKVYDVGGVEPDVPIEKPEMGPFLINLLKENMIFKYANYYNLKEKKLDNYVNFKFNDYDDFLKFIHENNFTYKTETLSKIEELEKLYLSENKSLKNANEFKILKDEAQNMKKLDEDKSKTQIIKLIEKEILLRQYLPDNGIKHMIQDDIEISKAVEVLNDKQLYNKILNITN